MSASTVKIDRAELEEIIVSLGALAGFADWIYGGRSLDSFLWNETLNIQKLLLEYAGLLTTSAETDQVAERRYERESVREKAMLAKYVEAVAS